MLPIRGEGHLDEEIDPQLSFSNHEIWLLFTFFLYLIQQFNFCSSEGFFPGCSDYDGRVEGSTGRARSQARSENHQSTEAADPKVSGRQSRSSSATSRSSSSSKRSGSGRRHEERDVSPHLVKNSSGDDSKKRRRKKPLAVAVGFNYANDGHGRPIVVTPGGSNTGSFRRSPPSTLGPYSSGSGLHDEGEGMREGN